VIKDRDSAFPKAEAQLQRVMEETAQELARRLAHR
jgi:hypothetical protein